MQTVRVQSGTEEEVWATTSVGGLFRRRSYESSFSQLRGTAQTSVFRNKAAFVAYLRRHGVHGRVVSDYGWE